MPIFKAKLSDGRTVTLEGDHKPTEEEVLSAVQGFKPDKAPAPQSLELPEDETLRSVREAFAPIEAERQRQRTFPAYLQEHLLEPVNRALEFSPADIANAPRNYPEAVASEILKQVNLPNVGLITGAGAIAKVPGVAADVAKAAIGSLFAKQMTEAGAQAAGKRLAGIPLTPEEKGALDVQIGLGALPSAGVVAVPKLLKGKEYASRIKSTEPVSELEVRPRMGEETPLRQQPEELAQAREPVRQEPQQGAEVPQEKVVATPLTPEEEPIEQARLAESEQGAKTEPKTESKEPWAIGITEHASHVRATKDGSLIDFDGKLIKPGDGIELHFMGGPSDMPRPWTLVKAENYPSSVNYKLNPRVIIRASNGKERTYDTANVYSPRKIDLANKPPKPSVSGATPSPVLPEGTLEKAGKATTLPAPTISVTPKTGKTQVELVKSKKEQVPNEYIETKPELQSPDDFLDSEIKKSRISPSKSDVSGSERGITFDLSEWTNSDKIEVEGIPDVFAYVPEGTDRFLVEFPKRTREEDAIASLREIYKGGRAGFTSDRWPTRHVESVKRALREGLPVSAEALETYGLRPANYVRAGELYVKTGKTQVGNEFVPEKFRLSNEEISKLSAEQKLLKSKLFKKDGTPKLKQNPEDLARFDELKSLAIEWNDYNRRQIELEHQFNREQNRKALNAIGINEGDEVSVSGYSVPVKGKVVATAIPGQVSVNLVQVSDLSKLTKKQGKPTVKPETISGSLEILGTKDNIKVTVPKEATAIRVTPKDKTKGQRVYFVSDLNSGKVTAAGGEYSKVEAGTIGKDKKFKPVKGEVTVEDKTPVITTPLSRGPGAAAAGEQGTYSPIQRMADELRVTANKSAPVDTQISTIQTAKNKLTGVKDAVVKSLSSLKAIKDAMWEKWNGLPEYGDEQRAVGKWFAALQQADMEARNFAKAITADVPNKLRREAITNWIQAEGDETLLRERAAASKGSIKAGYELATRLTEREKQIAVMLRDYYDQQLQAGIEAGILKDGLENYITQIWKRENPITKKLVSELSYSKLSPNFKYARKRIFDSYFEGEQAGFKPNKDAGFLVANYDQAFNKSLAARAFIKDLHEGKASDGRPLVEISGNGKLVDEGEANPTVLINPHAKPEEISDYRTIDHPALRGWKWATKTPDGKNVFVKGDMLVHPEAYQKLKNRLSVSAFRQNPISRAVLRGQTTIKQTMLSVSGFHQVQETLHALGHRVNPANLPEIDFSEPVTKALAEHGLQLSDYNALDSFSEGLAGGSLTSKIPIVGAKLHAYNEWLFQDYIPRLKLQMAKLTLQRNAERYPKLSQDKLLELTAKEANAAFGELPYRYMGRSPTLQDALRTFILAPDFLEARTRFVGRALSPYGREQLVALGILAATQYITARIVNQILDNDPHFETKNTFRIVAGNHAYGLRTIPADLIHLFSDSRGFFYNRMSPMLRTAFEAVSGRDDRGVKKDILEQSKDLARMPIPISIKPRLGTRWWETFLNAFGVQEQRYDAVQNIRQKSAEFKRQNSIVDPYETIYNAEKDPYEPLKIAIQDGNKVAAQAQFDKLKATIPQAKILTHFRDSLSRPFTGSNKNDAKFFNTLDAEGKQQFKEAKDLNSARLKMVQSLAGN